MSVHLVTCAAEIPLKPSEKLILLCLAENANSKDAIAFPGMDGLRMWSGLSPSRVQELLNVLTELRLIEQVGRGHRGRAAEYRVFPYGCCAAHGKEEIAADLSEAIEPVDSSTGRRLSAGKPPVFDEKASSFGPERVRSIGDPPSTPPKPSPSGLPTSSSDTEPSRPELRIVEESA